MSEILEEFAIYNEYKARMNNRNELISKVVKEERVKDIQAEKKYAPLLRNYDEFHELLRPKADQHHDTSYDHRTSVGLSEVLHFNMSRQEESFAKELDPIVYRNASSPEGNNFASDRSQPMSLMANPSDV